MRYLLLALFLLPNLVSAREFDLPERAPRRPDLFEIDRGGGDSGSMHEIGDVSIGGSVGLAFRPLGFLATAEADFWLASFFSIGPTVEFVAGEKIILGIAASPKFTVDFGHEWSELIKPYVHLGPGLAVVSGRHRHDHENHHHTELGLLILLGLGVDFYIWENVSFGTGLLFNWMPTVLVDERFFFAWKMFEVKFHF